MTTTTQSIIDFLTSNVSIGPRTPEQLSSLVSNLRTQINQLSVVVPDAPPGAVTLLYSGWVDERVHSGALAEAIAQSAHGQVVTINKTEVYRLLDSKDFEQALRSGQLHERYTKPRSWAR